jgi:hypothetical protein
MIFFKFLKTLSSIKMRKQLVNLLLTNITKDVKFIYKLKRYDEQYLLSIINFCLIWI